jgi:hypothetical protein
MENQLNIHSRQYLRSIFGPKREKVIGVGRKLQNELHDLYSSPTIVWVIKSRRMRWAGHEARLGEGSGVSGVLVGKPEGKRPLEKPRDGWEDNIKMDLQQIGCGGMDRIELAQDRGRWQALYLGTNAFHRL